MNETPFPPLPAIARLVEEEAARLQLYPDHAARALVTALAERLRVPADQVLVGPGSAGLCQHIIAALGQERRDVVHGALSFEAYPLLIMNAGGRPVPVPMAGDRHDLAAMAGAVTADTRCVLLCNPNNPTGTAVRRHEVVRFLRQIPPDVTVLIDEAYREFVTDPEVPDGVDLARDHASVCVLRTFSKAYGLASLRVGYAVAPPDLAAAARRMGSVFFPGSLGQRAAAASLAPELAGQVAARCAQVTAERERMRQALAGAGYAVGPSQANFLWLPLREDAGRFASACERAGLLVRAYPGHGVRVTISTRAANERFLAVAAAFLPGGAA